MMSSGPFSAFRLTTCGVDSLDRHTLKGVSHVLSILDPGNHRPQALSGFTADCRLELRFHDIVVVEDDGVPPDETISSRYSRWADRGCLREWRAPADPLLCGAVRSTAAAALCLAQEYPIRSGYEVLGEVVRQNPRTWPNLLMLELGDKALGAKAS